MAKTPKAAAKTWKFTQKLARKFCELCNDAHQGWQLHRSLFDDNAHLRWLWRSPARRALGTLAGITRSHSLLQVRKLHDPPYTMGRANLSINYVLEHKRWPTAVRKQLLNLKQQLDAFADPLALARNRTLSHNDLEAVMSGKRLGRFAKDNDVEYFEALLKFAGLVFETTTKGDSFPFCRSQAQRDVRELVAMLKAAMYGR